MSEDSLKQPGQLFARRTVAHFVPMAHHFTRIEHIHVNVYVDLISESTKTVNFNRNKLQPSLPVYVLLRQLSDCCVETER